MRHALALRIHPAQRALRRGIVLVGRLADELEGFVVILRHTLGVNVKIGQIVLCGGVILAGRLAKPLDRLGIILGHTPALDVKIAQIVLGLGVTTFRRPAQISGAQDQILGHTVALDVKHAEGTLGGGEILVGGLAHPFDRLAEVRLDPLAFRIHQGQIAFRIGIALIRRFLKPLGRLIKIHRHFPPAIFTGQAHAILRLGITRFRLGPEAVQCYSIVASNSVDVSPASATVCTNTPAVTVSIPPFALDGAFDYPGYLLASSGMVLYGAVRGTTLYVATWSPGTNGPNDHFIFVSDQLLPAATAAAPWAKAGTVAVAANKPLPGR